MGVLLAFCAAFSYGISDFVAGLSSRRASAYSVAALGQVGALAVGVLCAAFLLPPEHLTGTAMAWGAASGIGNGLGTLFLYRGLGSGRMSVVAPLSAVTAAGLPVLTGLALGERPPALAIVGIVLALPAIALISRTSSERAADRRGVVDGLLAGAGFGLLFIGLGRVPAGSGFWPLVAGQVVALLTVLVAALATRAALRARGRPLGGALAAGAIGAASTALYMLAAQRTLLSIVAVVTSLYPALTVLAAMAVLRERIGRGQAVGLAAAAAAVTLIALR